MTLKALRPVGNRIHSQASSAHHSLAAGYHTYWLNSGTAALALAIIAAKTLHPAADPEVILPTYGCPDLVAAARHAGVRAVLVDIRGDSPWYDYEQLRAALTPNTVAIVAVTLLGIRAKADELRAIISGRPISLIEDSAQWLPRNNSQSFFGDYVVISFGRGKPVNLLGGGSLLTRTELPEAVTGHIRSNTNRSSAEVKYWLKRKAYNAVISPTLYGFLQKIPFLHIGETTLHELTSICSMNVAGRKLLWANFDAYSHRELEVQRRWTEVIANLPHAQLKDLCVSHGLPDDYALLRYPLLAGSDRLQETLYKALCEQGLGPSVMYARPLMEIPGVSNYATLFSTQQGAEMFSRRLLTLPTHDAVDDRVIEQTVAILQRISLSAQ